MSTAAVELECKFSVLNLVLLIVRIDNLKIVQAREYSTDKYLGKK